MAGAMLECAVCSSRRWKSLEDAHAVDLPVSGAARLFCESCTRETYWLYSQHSGGAAAPRRTSEPPARADANVIAGQEPAAGPANAEPDSVPKGPVRSLQTERRFASDRRGRSRRTNRRVALQVLVRLRVSSACSQFEEVTRTVNVSRNGIYIQTERPFAHGLPLYVAMNYPPREPGLLPEQKATVVRVDPVPNSPARGVAIQLL